MPDEGVSQSYVDSEISALEDRVDAKIDELRREMEYAINRLIEEIRNQTDQLGRHMTLQTEALVAEATIHATLLEQTKLQLANDFDETRKQLSEQNEAERRIQLGDKIAQLSAGRGKIDAFVTDIKGRFEKSIEALFQNRRLYNINFQKIYEEYDNKLRAIGQHIYEIQNIDLAPAEQAAHAPVTEIHSLPIEVDIERLRIRTDNLEACLKMLKDTRLDDVLESLNRLRSNLTRFDGSRPKGDLRASVGGVFVEIDGARDLLVSAKPTVNGSAFPKFEKPTDGFSEYCSERAIQIVGSTASSRTRRDLTGVEKNRLSGAAKALLERGQISLEASELFSEFLSKDKLKYFA